MTSVSDTSSQPTYDDMIMGVKISSTQAANSQILAGHPDLVGSAPKPDDVSYRFEDIGPSFARQSSHIVGADPDGWSEEHGTSSLKEDTLDRSVVLQQIEGALVAAGFPGA